MLRAGASGVASPEETPRKLNKSGIETTVQLSRWFLRPLGVWSMVTKNPSTAERYISKCLIVFCLIAIAYPLVPTALHTLLREKNPLVRLMRLGPIASCLSSILKYGFTVFRCKAIKFCMEHMDSDWTRIESENERAIMLRNGKLGRVITIIACIFMYTGGVFYHVIMPLLKGSKLNERNETVRPLVYSGFDIFVDPQKSPAYEIIFWTTFAAAFVRYTVTIAACHLAAVFVTHACGQVQIAMSRLDNLFDEIDERRNCQELQKRISSIVQCHARGLRFSSKIDDALREICLIEFVAATLIICLLEYYCMTEWNNSEPIAILTYVIFLLSYIFNIFIFCWIGELLQDQCYEVGRSTSLIDWYRLPGKTGLALVMILAMSNYPRKITAGGMIDLSVASFGMIMKTSIMYSNVLRQMAD